MTGIKNLLTLVISVMLVLTSTFMPSKVNDPNELSRVGFGYPLHFWFQDQSTLDPIAVNYALYLLSPLEYPVADFSPANLFLSIFIIWGMFIIIFRLWVVLKRLYLQQGTP